MKRPEGSREMPHVNNACDLCDKPYTVYYMAKHANKKGYGCCDGRHVLCFDCAATEGLIAKDGSYHPSLNCEKHRRNDKSTSD
jgi:hypothetical protein